MSPEEQPPVSQQILEMLWVRFVAERALQPLMDWAMWLGDHLNRIPELAKDLNLTPVHEWMGLAPKDDLERFAQIWLALLAEHSDLPEEMFELVPRCAACLRLDDFDSSTWISLIDIMDKRAADEALTRLTWEGKTLQHFLTLERTEVGKNPDLDMALFECLRRWAELPPHRLAMADVSADALHAWLGA